MNVRRTKSICLSLDHVFMAGQHLLISDIAGNCHCYMVAILMNRENCFAHKFAVHAIEKYVWHAKMDVCVCIHQPNYPFSLA